MNSNFSLLKNILTMSLLVLGKQGRDTLGMFWHGVSKSAIGARKKVDIIASPLQLVSGRQIYSPRGFQRSERKGYVKAVLLPLLLSSSQKKKLR